MDNFPFVSHSRDEMRQLIEDIERPLALLLMAVVMAVVVATLIFFGIRHFSKIREAAKREAAYQSALLSYTRVLKPGIRRKEVEDYLRARNVEFGQMCCVGKQVPQKRSLDDIAKVGQENAPWFCSEHNVFVAFQFEDHGQYKSILGADDKDILKAVTIYHQLGGCL
jgi:hypothetical protein